MKILQYPNSILTDKALSVGKLDKTFRDNVHDMIHLMNSHRGLGLSAPQVGLKQLFFVWKFYPSVVVNPAIVSRRGRVFGMESCLSIIDGYDENGPIYPEYEVARSEKIEVECWDYKGREITIKLKGLPAIVWQHESDHCLGRLINRA